MPPCSDVVSLADEVGDFFADKVSRMHAALDGNTAAVDDDGLEDGNCPVSFEKFNILSPEDVRDLICRAVKKSCPLDPKLTTLVTQCLEERILVLADMIFASVGSFCREVERSFSYTPSEKGGLGTDECELASRE